MTGRVLRSIADLPPLVVVVGSGGVGKTTLAAAMGLVSARAGARTLVMTFDPSLRLKDALGVSAAEHDEEIRVDTDTEAPLFASLLDARRTFDRLIERYAPDAEARDRILGNAYYDHLAGHLGGILEYMAVERLYEVAREGGYDRVILDTPPARQAIDFLEAPKRIVQFLDSGALRIALKDWFDDSGKLKPVRRLGGFGRGIEGFLDRVVGLKLLRDMSEFFHAFGPLFEGFGERAGKVEKLLASERTEFVLVAGPGAERIPDTLFFARRLDEAGLHLGPLVVNRMHPELEEDTAKALESSSGRELFRWLAERHRRGLEELRQLLPDSQQIVPQPLIGQPPTDLLSLEALGMAFQDRLAGSAGKP